MLNSLRLLPILFIGTASTAGDILRSKTVRALVLIAWVIISMLVLFVTSVGFILHGSLVDTVFGIFAALFSLVPVYVYYDLRRSR